MNAKSNINISCPRCESDAIYKYGKTKSGKQRYICILCKRQFTNEQAKKSEAILCDICKSKMYVYMKDNIRNIIRYRCSKYPKCKKYKIGRLI